MARFKHKKIYRGYGCPVKCFLILPSIFLKAVFELYCLSQGLLFLLALPLNIHAMCTFISLNVLESTLAVSYGIELRPRYTAVCCTSCFPCHILSPFYLSVDDPALFNGYQPIKCHEGNYKEKNAPTVSVRIQSILRRSSKCNGLSLKITSYLAKAFLIMPMIAMRIPPPTPPRRLERQHPSVEQFLRNVAAVVGELLQYGLVQPYIHLCRVAHLLGWTPEFDCKLLPCSKAALETQQLQ